MSNRLEIPPEAETVLLENQINRYQAIISRLALNGVQVRTWCITAVGALVTLAANTGQAELLAVALVVLLCFSLLDSYYLLLERFFRDTSESLIEDMYAGQISDWRKLFSVSEPSAASHWHEAVTGVLSLAVTPVLRDRWRAAITRTSP